MAHSPCDYALNKSVNESLTHFKHVNEIFFDPYDYVKGLEGVSVIWKDMVFVNDRWDKDFIVKILPRGQNPRTGCNLIWHDPKTCPIWMDAMNHKLHP